MHYALSALRVALSGESAVLIADSYLLPAASCQLPANPGLNGLNNSIDSTDD